MGPENDNKKLNAVDIITEPLNIGQHIERVQSENDQNENCSLSIVCAGGLRNNNGVSVSTMTMKTTKSKTTCTHSFGCALYCCFCMRAAVREWVGQISSSHTLHDKLWKTSKYGKHFRYRNSRAHTHTHTEPNLHNVFEMCFQVSAVCVCVFSVWFNEMMINFLYDLLTHTFASTHIPCPISKIQWHSMLNGVGTRYREEYARGSLTQSHTQAARNQCFPFTLMLMRRPKPCSCLCNHFTRLFY